MTESEAETEAEADSEAEAETSLDFEIREVDDEDSEMESSMLIRPSGTVNLISSMSFSSFLAVVSTAPYSISIFVLWWCRLIKCRKKNFAEVKPKKRKKLMSSQLLDLP